MPADPDKNDEYGYGVNETGTSRGNELPAGYFVNRDEEQDLFRVMLRGILGNKPSFFGSLMGSQSSRQAQVDSSIKSRVILINGPSGIGKTRLSLRLREISQKEKGFARRFRTTRIDWNEVRERDQRMSQLVSENLSPGTLLDILYTHFVREDLGSYFEEYKVSLAETRELFLKVQGAELEAVWEYRARALGRGLESLSLDRPLLFFQDNFEKLRGSIKVLKAALEESGPLVIWVFNLVEEFTELSKNVSPSRFLSLKPGKLSRAELQQFFTTELARYSISEPEEVSQGKGGIAFRSPEQIERLHQVTDGMPLNAKITAFLIQSGIPVDNLPLPVENPIKTLTLLFFNDPLGPGHPDRQKLLALALLRRPERGLWAAMLDLRQDMLSTPEVLNQVQTRYSFLMEPLRQMVLHEAVAQPVWEWMLQPEQRFNEQGLGKLNRRAMGYLNERLESWAENFPTLQGRIQEIKWREWALDKVWHAFWIGQEEGWREAIPLFVAGLGYHPALATEINEIIEWFFQRGAIYDEPGNNRQEWLKQVSNGGPEIHNALAEIQSFETTNKLFRQKMPRFANELALILEQKLFS